MKRLLAVAMIATLALGGVATNSMASKAPQTVQRLERRVAWQERHIEKLNNRRDHLHHYIRHLRKAFHHAGTTATTSTRSYSGGVLSAAQVASYARGAGFPESVIPTMVSIAYRESRFNPGAINSSSGACGLWQIYPAQSGCTNPVANAAMAYAKYRASGLSPWGL